MSKLNRTTFNVLTVFIVICLTVTIGIAEDKTFNIKVQSIHKGEMSNILEGSVLKQIEKISGGRLKFTIFQSGELVKQNEILDAVSKGMIQAGCDFPGYWAGKNTAFDLLATSPVSMSKTDFYNWYYSGGGKALYQEVYGLYGCVYFPYFLLDSESGFRTNKPIRSIEDFKGLKIRTAGYMVARLLESLGAAPASVPFSEIFEALQRGVIDGCEISVPQLDWMFGFQDNTKYVLNPAWHQPYGVLGLIINKKFWDTLPDDLKLILEYSLEGLSHIESSKFTKLNMTAFDNFQKKGIIATRLSDEEINKIEQMKNPIQEKLAKENPLYAKILKSQYEFMKSYEKYRNSMAPYVPSRNPVYYPKID